MRTAVKCGIYDAGNGFEEVWRLTETDELIVSDQIMGNLFISPIKVSDTHSFDTNDAAVDICNALECTGVVLTDSYLITFKDGVASYRNTADVNDIIKTVDCDTDTVCEELINWVVA